MELASYRDSLERKKQVVALNKVDLPEVQARVPQLRNQFNANGTDVFFISADTKQGLSELLDILAEMVDKADEELVMNDTPEFIFRPKPKPRNKK
jgi:GTP-binding protein